MNTNVKGNIGEAKAIAHFLQEGYEVFVAFGTASKFDLVIHKDGVLQTVSVKMTSGKVNDAYTVRLTQITRKGESDFDNSVVDILAVYIAPEDKLVTFDAKKLTNRTRLNIKMAR